MRRLRIITIVCSFSLHAFPWLALILFLPLGQKETENFTAHAESSMFTSFDLSSYCGKKTGCISLSFSLMLCWVNNDDAILKVNPYLEDILCIRKFRPLCSFPSRCVRLGEDPISEATRKQICETRIEDEREYKVFVTVVCYWKLFFAFILVQEMSLERTVALEMEYFPFSHWWFTKYIIFYSSMKVQQTKIQL